MVCGNLLKLKLLSSILPLFLPYSIFLSVNNLSYCPHLCLPHFITFFSKSHIKSIIKFYQYYFQNAARIQSSFARLSTSLVLPVSFLPRHGQLFPNWSHFLVLCIFTEVLVEWPCTLFLVLLFSSMYSYYLFCHHVW